MSKFLAKMKVLYYYFCILIRSTGSRQVDRHVTQRRALILIGWATPVNETGSSTSDQVNCNYEKCIIILSKLWIEYLGSTVQSLFTKKTPTFFKELMDFFMRTPNPERVFFSWKSFKKHQKDTLIFRSRICRFIFEVDITVGTDFAQCDVNDVTIPIEKKHCLIRHQLQRRVVWIQKW